MECFKSERLGAVLKGATITGFWVLPNGREVMLETTAGCVPMTNELTYQLVPKTASAPVVDSRVETKKFVPDNGC